MLTLVQSRHGTGLSLKQMLIRSKNSDRTSDRQDLLVKKGKISLAYHLIYKIFHAVDKFGFITSSQWLVLLLLIIVSTSFIVFTFSFVS